MSYCEFFFKYYQEMPFFKVIISNANNTANNFDMIVLKQLKVYNI